MAFSSSYLKIRNTYIYNKYAHNDIRIVSISDIHISKLISINKLKALLDIVKDIKPNYILLPGDLIDSPYELNNPESVKKLDYLLKECANITTTIMILGNHEYIDYKLKLDLTNITDYWNSTKSIKNFYLLNDSIYQDDFIFIAGYKQKLKTYYSDNMRGEDSLSFIKDIRNFKNMNTKKRLPKIFLTHSPEPIQDNSVKKILDGFDIILTGHYHNGCVPEFLNKILPKNMGIVLPCKKLFPKHARGIEKINNKTTLIYGGGFTKIQECAPFIFRPLDKLCNRQMDVITISSNPEYKNIKVFEDKKKIV